MASAQATAVNVPTTTETVAVASPLFVTNNPAGQGVLISGIVNILAGTSTTAVVVRIRQGSVTGTLVGVATTHTLAAGASANIAFEALDSSALALNTGSAGSVWVVTVQQTGGAAAGTVNIAVIEVQNEAASV